MLRRLSTGEVIDPSWTRFSYPSGYHHDLLRGLDHMRSSGVAPDERVAEAMAIVDSKCDSEGRWPLENPHPGQLDFDMEEAEGRPSRWNTLRNTLRAMRVLRWYNRHQVQGAA